MIDANKLREMGNAIIANLTAHLQDEPLLVRFVEWNLPTLTVEYDANHSRQMLTLCEEFKTNHQIRVTVRITLMENPDEILKK